MKILKVFAVFLLVLSLPFQLLGLLWGFVCGSLKSGADFWDQFMAWASDRV